MYTKWIRRRPPIRPLQLRNHMPILTSDYPIRVCKNLKANQDYTKFFYRFSHEGKSYKNIVDCTKKSWNKRERIRYAEAQLMQAREDAETLLDRNATVDDIVQLYLDTLQNGNYKRNRYSYYKRKVKSKLGKKKARSILPMQIQELVNQYIKDGDKPATARQVIEVLSPAFNIARKNRLLNYNPCIDVKIKREKTLKIVNDATIVLKQILDAIIELYENDPYFFSFFLFALHGRRKSEILNLRWENISFTYDYYVLTNTKNDEEQKIFLPPNIKEALLLFQKKRGWVFESPIHPGEHLTDANKQIAKLKKKLGNWFTMHVTRNVMVTAMAEQGIEAIYMSGALGHNDPNTVTRYLTMNYIKGSKIASDMIQPKVTANTNSHKQEIEYYI